MTTLASLECCAGDIRALAGVVQGRRSPSEQLDVVGAQIGGLHDVVSWLVETTKQMW